MGRTSATGRRRSGSRCPLRRFAAGAGAAAGAFLLVQPTLAGCGGRPPNPAPPPPAPAAQLRIGTLNTKLIPFTGTGSRVDTIAARILSADLDVVALQEVFSEAARDELVTALGADYPWSVDRLGSGRPLRSDSGLMLFSRLPFEPLADSVAGRPPALRARVAGRPADGSPVRFLAYGPCARADCRVGKGAGYVRLRVAGRPLHLFFTHMQAPYGTDPPEGERETAGIRAIQRRELAAFMERVVGPSRLGRENILLVGDLNVDGSADLTGGFSHRTEIVGDERARMMEELGAPFPGGLTDLWRAHRSGDPGLTFPLPRLATRFDYALASLPDPDSDLCVTRIERAFGLDPRLDPDSVDVVHERWITDHVGVVAELAERSSAACLQQPRR